MKRRTHLDYDATIATSHLRRGTSEEAEAPRHLTHHKVPNTQLKLQIALVLQLLLENTKCGIHADERVRVAAGTPTSTQHHPEQEASESSVKYALAAADFTTVYLGVLAYHTRSTSCTPCMTSSHVHVAP